MANKQVKNSKHPLGVEIQSDLTVEEPKLNTHSTHECPQCGVPLVCDIAAGKVDCWCFNIETKAAASTVNENDLCLCLSCLAKAPPAK